MQPSVLRALASLMVGAAVVLAGCGSAPDTVTPPPSVQASPAASPVGASPSPIAAASPSPSTALTGWTRVAFGTGAWPRGLATLDGMFAALGQVDVHVAAWTSADGRAWQPSIMTGQGTGVIKAVPFRSGLVGVGCALGIGCLTKKAPAGVWTSTDGRTWTPHALPLDLPYAGVSDIAATSDVAVVVGSGTDCPPEVGGVGAVLAAAHLVACGRHAEGWWSSDGVAWHLVRASACGSVLGSVAGTASGMFVAVDDISHACLSSDGRRWHAATGTLPGGIGIGVGVLVATGSGLLATTGDGIWASTDGSSWSHAPGLPPASAQLWGLASTGGRIVAFGQQAGGAVAWLSADGRSWVPLPGDPTFAGQVLWSAALMGNRLVVAGGPSSFLGDPGGSTWVADLTGAGALP